MKRIFFLLLFTSVLFSFSPAFSYCAVDQPFYSKSSTTPLIGTRFSIQNGYYLIVDTITKESSAPIYRADLRFFDQNNALIRTDTFGIDTTNVQTYTFNLSSYLYTFEPRVNADVLSLDYFYRSYSVPQSFTYQQRLVAGSKLDIENGYALKLDGFVIGPYDKAQILVVDSASGMTIMQLSIQENTDTTVTLFSHRYKIHVGTITPNARYQAVGITYAYRRLYC